MADETQEITEGDRIDHKVFGLGTANDVSGPVSPESQVSGEQSRVEVIWDDPDRQTCWVMSWALTKVSSAETRPPSYWNKQWEQLRADWLARRRDVEDLWVTFAHLPDDVKVTNALRAEWLAWEKIQAFLNEPKM